MLVESDIATPLRDGTYAGEFTLPDGADQVTVNFQDANGAVVHSETLGAQEAGNVAFAWDGKNEAGEYVAGGPLRMVVTATKDGQTSQRGDRHLDLDRRHPVARQRQRKPARHRPRPARAERRHPPRLTPSQQITQGATPCPSTPRSPASAAPRPICRPSRTTSRMSARSASSAAAPTSATSCRPRARPPGQGTRLKGIEQQFTQGGFETSARDLDLAISGSGFFVTRDALTGGTTYFSRNGSLSVDSQRYLVD